MTKPSALTFALIWVAITLLIAALPWLGVGNASLRLVILVALLALNVSSINLSMGYAGEMNLGQAAYYAAGAYLTGYLALNYTNDLGISIACSILVGLVLGVLSALPALRLSGWVLAVGSFFLVLLTPNIVQSLGPSFGGHEGLAGIPRPSVFGMSLGRTGYYVAVVLITSTTFLLFRNLIVSRYGAALLVLKSGAVLSRSLGVSPHILRFKIYALSAVAPAVAGSMFAYLDGFVGPETFSLDHSIAFLAGSILGGTSSIYGPFIGAFLMQIGPLRSTAFENYALVAYGVFLLASGLLLSGGIAGLVNRVRDRMRRQGNVDVPMAHVQRPIEPIPGVELRIRGLSKSFGGLKAAQDISFVAESGKVTGLIGPNGSGKTTVLNLVSGFYPSDSGSAQLGGVGLIGNRAHQIARLGVARTFQTPQLPEKLTVAEVIATGRHAKEWPSIVETMLRLPRFLRLSRDDERIGQELASACGLSALADTQAASLPLGTRRVVELARSMAASPRLILLDEIASGLDEAEIASLKEMIRALRNAGATIILVEHNFDLVRSLADHVVVLSQGAVIWEGAAGDVEKDEAVRREYFGDQAIKFTGGSSTASVTAG